MTNNDDVDSVDAGPTDHDDSKHSKRALFKGALSRTKTKITKVKEDYEAKKQQQQQAKVETQHKHDDDVDDFLSAGRPSNASSQRPTITSNGSDVLLSEPSTTPPRPSTADSKSPTQLSPRRAAVNVPRIDVSSALRFPNAKEIDLHSTPRRQDSDVLSNGSSQSSALLKPNYKTRSQSSSSLASANGPRRARLRGLSVGFADAPPIVIGEGGDEAEAPAIEISRAKERARSASPQGRRPLQQQGLPTRPAPNSSQQSPGDDFVPKPFLRSQTGLSSLDGDQTSTQNPNAVPPAPQDDFIPKPFSRTQTGLSSIDSGQDRQTPASRVPDMPKYNTMHSPISEREAPLPPSLLTKQPNFYAPYVPDSQRTSSAGPEQNSVKRIVPSELPPMQTTGLDLSREFEMTLGLGTPNSAGSGPGGQLPTQIMAPKPKRAPPSYDLIEGGGMPAGNHQNQSPPPAAKLNQSALQPQHTISNISSNPLHMTREPSATMPIGSIQSQPPMASQAGSTPYDHPSTRTYTDQARKPVPEYFPPPPQRTLTQTARIPRMINPIHNQTPQPPQPQQPSDLPRQQSESHIIPRTAARGQEPHAQHSQQVPEYQTFAERQNRAGANDLSRKTAHTELRSITTDYYQASPSEYTSSAVTPGRLRFYESMSKNDGFTSGGFI